ncbi:MAG: hypothetical protein JWO19_52 [Bryobacterales bacterium]|jgi:hypothetical protein|nr:hypothetical protein [Bryobacterales bacterium]
MHLQFSLLVAGSVLLYGQTPATQAVNPSPVQDLRTQVDAGIAPRALVDQAEAAAAAARDAELLNGPVSLDDLTEERATQLEEAARRQLDRSKARLAQVRTLVDAGLVPAQRLTAPTQELAWAQTTYDLTLSRTELIHQVAEMARAEQQFVEPPKDLAIAAAPLMERFDGDGAFTPADLQRVKRAFELQFHKELPVSADGETAVHRAMGFDHRNRVDVALFPDTAEGIWLRRFLEASAIPYYAFRSLIPGKATAAHIHIGPPSNRISARSGA